MHFHFGLGALCSPLFVRASMAIRGGQDYSLAMWMFGLFCVIPAVWLPALEAPQLKKKEENEGNDKSHYWWTLAVVGLTNLFLGVYVGAETGFGSFVLVYAKWNL